jgi:hypothetical protein
MTALDRGAHGPIREPEAIRDLAQALPRPAPHDHARCGKAVRDDFAVSVNRLEGIQAVGRSVQERTNELGVSIVCFEHGCVDADLLQAIAATGPPIPQR